MAEKVKYGYQLVDEVSGSIIKVGDYEHDSLADASKAGEEDGEQTFGAQQRHVSVVITRSDGKAVTKEDTEKQEDQPDPNVPV